MQEDAKGEKNRDKDQKCAETRTGHCSNGNVYEWEGIHEVRDTWSETNDGRDARHKGESGAEMIRENSRTPPERETLENRDTRRARQHMSTPARMGDTTGKQIKGD